MTHKNTDFKEITEEQQNINGQLFNKLTHECVDLIKKQDKSKFPDTIDEEEVVSTDTAVLHLPIMATINDAYYKGWLDAKKLFNKE